MTDKLTQELMIDEIFKLAKFGDYQMTDGIPSNRTKIAELITQAIEQAREELISDIVLCKGDDPITRKIFLDGKREGIESAELGQVLKDFMQGKREGIEQAKGEAFEDSAKMFDGYQSEEKWTGSQVASSIRALAISRALKPVER